MKITKAEIQNMLKEDRALQDITTNNIIVQNKMHNFEIISKNNTPFILCEVDALTRALESTLAKYDILSRREDGDMIKGGDVIIKGTASIKELLQIERTVLNIIQHLSGVATKAHHFVQKLGSDHIKILDTRKTIPYLRKLQKYAVTVGGGFNHRMNLEEMAMVKDNHIIAAGSIKEAVRLLQRKLANTRIEVECDDLFQVKEATECEIDVILLDNMSVSEIKEASKIIRKNSQIQIEVSGGVTLDNIHYYKGLDIDYISIGSLTHSVEAVDISMEVMS